MKKLASALLPFAFYLGLCSSPVQAAEQKQDRKLEQMVEVTTPGAAQETDARWRVTVGGTWAKPKLTKANDAIRGVEGQIKAIAPEIRRFQTWDDIFIGTAGAGVSYSFDIGKLVVSPEIFYAFGSGNVQTNFENVRTIYGAPMSGSHYQDYTLHQVSFTLHLSSEKLLPQFKTHGLVFGVGGGPVYGHLSSETRVKSAVPTLGISQEVNGRFAENALGWAAIARILYEPQFLKDTILEGSGIHIEGRMDWMKFKGPTRITDTQMSPFGHSKTQYDLTSESDITGKRPGIYFGFFKRF
jgi:hypothetical protein